MFSQHVCVACYHFRFLKVFHFSFCKTLSWMRFSSFGKLACSLQGFFPVMTWQISLLPLCSVMWYSKYSKISFLLSTRQSGSSFAWGGAVRSDLELPNHFATRVYRLKWMRINPPLNKLFDKKVRLTLIIYYSHVKILPRLSCADFFFLILLQCIPRIDLISVFYARKHCKK